MSQYETTVRYFDHAANLMGLSKNMQALLLIARARTQGPSGARAR